MSNEPIELKPCPWCKTAPEQHFSTTQGLLVRCESHTNWLAAKTWNTRPESVNAELLAACVEFVRKVECGEARSRRSYAQMKLAIKNYEDTLAKGIK